MGRPKKRVTNRHITRAEKDARLKDLSVSGDITAPDFLSNRAKEEFYRVVSCFKDLGTLDSLDLSTLAIYADAWDNYEKLAEIIDKYGPVLIKRRVTGKTEIEPNPALSVQSDYVKRIMQCSTKLGLATTDRLRLAVPTNEEEEDEFSSFEGRV